MSRAAQIALIVFVATLVVCSMEMIPGWGMMDLEWPRWVFYMIIGIVGAVTGFVGIENYRLPALISGPVVGVGALYASAILLERVSETHDAVIVFVEGIGALPGIGLFFLLRLIQDKRTSTLPPQA
jgi:hypothetical protein